MPGRAERKEASRVARRSEDRREEGGAADEARPAKRRGGSAHSRPYGLEYRVRPGRSTLWNGEWRRSWKWYRTEARRDAAMAAMNRRDDLFEYRPTSRAGTTGAPVEKA